ncbi:hypothetical protein HUE56_25960 (plasmid) [Azospirillum oryzae]|uniref:Uncharacterized protein n=1 Tax=Azospirillum oryzae TaxID=286727 RepID=A0A6N1ARH4_9PROT|nr:hypothetical protein [Azospirillum oryzae]KAA0587827.1 hypothetical protein FZ938_16725 [Azospirillum oryzae]QKS53943.1 hypothetical protein HUE56_25960 [Azospirillum oryzae]
MPLSDTFSLQPLSDLVDPADFPLFEHVSIDVAGSGEEMGKLVSSIYFANAFSRTDGVNVVIETDLFFEQALPAVQLPGFDAFSIRIGATAAGWGRAGAVLTVGPDLALQLTKLTASLVVAPEVLARADDRSKGAELTISGGLTLSPSGISFDGFHEAKLTAAYLAGTDLLLSASGISVVEDPRAGGSAVSMKRATVQLPKDWVATEGGGAVEITAEDVLIGASGLSGRFRLTQAGAITGKLFGFAFRLRDCTIELVEGALREASLLADVHLAPLDEDGKETWVGLDVSFGRDGVRAALLPIAAQPSSGRRPQDFDADEQTDGQPESDNVAGAMAVSKDDEAAEGAEPAFAFTVSIKDLFRLGVKSLRLEQVKGEWVVFLSGTLTPLIQGGKWPALVFDEIGIGSSSGIILPEGSGIAIAAPLVADWHFAKLTLTSFRLARPPGPQRALELALSADVSIISGLPAGASVEGLVVTWYQDTSTVDVRFDGIGVAFGVPGSFDAGVTISYKQGASPRFLGKGHLNLDALDVRLDITVEAGRDDGLNYFFLTADAEIFPGGIPIGATGLSLYGVSGLLAYNMAPAVEDNHGSPTDKKYLELFLKEPVGLTARNKWTPRSGHGAIGLGAVIGTADDGTVFHCKGMLLVTLPDLDLFLQARADFIERRQGLKDDKTGSIDALLAYHSGENLLAFDMRAQWGKDDLFSVGGSAHARFYFDKPLEFLLELGKEPPSERVSARALRASGEWLLDASYWMCLDARGMRTCISAHFGSRYEAAGFWAEISGSLNASMGLFWDAPQWEGSASFEGYAGLGCGDFSLGVGVNADVDACVPNPLRFAVSAKACITIDVWFDSWELCLAHRFAWERPDPPKLIDPVVSVVAEPRLWTSRPAPEGADRKVDDGVVPLAEASSGAISDVWPHSVLTIDFAKSMSQEGPSFHGHEKVRPVAIAQQSGYSASYVLTRLELVCGSDPNATPTLFGTWVKSPASRSIPGSTQRHEPRPPNTCLQLLSSDRFGRRGSLSGGGAEDSQIDYCLKEDNSPETVCVSLAGMQIGHGRLENGWIYRWTLNADVDPAKGIRDNVGGILYQYSDVVAFLPTKNVTKVEAHLARYVPGGPLEEMRQEMLSRPAGTEDWITLPSAWGEAGWAVVRLCWSRDRVSPPGSVEVISRTGSAGIEEWSIQPGDQLLRPGETYDLVIAGEKRLYLHDTTAAVSVTPFHHTYRFRARSAPDYPGALANAIAGVYPADGARPVYTGYDFVIRFKEAFVPALYRAERRRLALRLFDGSGNLVTNDKGDVFLPLVNQDGPTEPPPVEQWWREIYTRDPETCVEGEPYREEHKSELALPLSTVKLAPTTRYMAHIVVVTLNGAPQDEDVPILATWSFTTSAYETFTALFRNRMDKSQINEPEVAPRGVRLTSMPLVDEFDAFARVCGVPVVAVTKKTRLSPVYGPAGLMGVLMEAPEPLDDEAGRLTLTLDGRATRLLPNPDRTRFFAMLDGPASVAPWPPDAVAFKIVWKHNPAGNRELWRRIAGKGFDETIELAIPLELPQ